MLFVRYSLLANTVPAIDPTEKTSCSGQAFFPPSIFTSGATVPIVPLPGKRQTPTPDANIESKADIISKHGRAYD